MPVTRAKKSEQVETLHAELNTARNLIVATFSRLTVAEDYELRKQVRSSGARYRVVKNTLAEIAARGTPAEPVLKNLAGVTTIAYTTGDPVALAKALQKYAKENPAVTFKAGVVEGRAVSVAEIAQLATLPSKEELYSKVLFLIQSPAQRLVTVLSAVGRNTAVVIDQAVKAKKFSE